jgi:hypothetical protein
MFVLKLHVANICFKCFKCFRGMLQVFHTNVVKVDRDVAHVAMVVQVCCKLLFSMFHLFFFRRMLQVYLSGCCICFHTYCRCLGPWGPKPTSEFMLRVPNLYGDAKRIHGGFYPGSGERRPYVQRGGVLYFLAPKCLRRGYKL